MSKKPLCKNCGTEDCSPKTCDVRRRIREVQRAFEYKKPFFKKKDGAKMMQRLEKKINIPAWGLVLFIAVAVLALGLLLQMMIREEKDTAVQNYKEAEYLRSASLHDVQNLVIKEAWYRTGKMLPFIIFILSVGAAFGLANGVALVRVSK